MRIRLERITKKELKHFHFTDEDKSIKVIDGIPTTSFHKSLLMKDVLDGGNIVEAISNYIKNSRNGVRTVYNKLGKQLIFRKAGDDFNEELIEHLGFFIKCNDEMIYLYYDKKYFDQKYINFDINLDKPFLEIIPEFLETLNKEENIEYLVNETITSIPVALNDVYQNVRKWITIQDENDLVEMYSYQMANQLLSDMIKNNKLDSQAIVAIQNMNMFICSNMTGFNGDKKYIHPLVWQFQKIITSYHKDKTPVKDKVCRDKIITILKTFYPNIQEVIQQTESNLDENKLDNYKDKEIKEDNKETITPIVQNNQESNIENKEEIINTNNSEEIEMGRKSKALRKQEIEAKNFTKNLGLTKERMAEEIGRGMTDALERISQHKVNSNIAKMIFMQLDKFGDNAMDLATQIILASNKFAEEIQANKSKNDGLVDYNKVKDAYNKMEMLRKAASWIIEFKNEVMLARSKNQILPIDTVVLKGGNVLFCFNSHKGFPYIIDAQSLQCVLEFEPSNSNYDFVDINYDDFMKKYDDFLKASGLCSTLFVDNAEVLDPNKIISSTLIDETKID